MEYKISIEPQGEVYRNIHIEIPREEYSRRFDAAVSRTSSKARLKGFRPGKAPREMIAKMYRSELHHEVMETLASTAIRSAVEKHALDVVGMPKVTFGDDDGTKDIAITANVAVVPKPEISGHDKLKLEVEVRTVTDADYDREIDGMREQQSQFKKIEDRDNAQEGDYALVSYAATVDGEPFGKSDKPEERFVKVGGGMLMPELDELLKTAKRGETKEIEIPVSPDYPDAKFAGKTAVYKLELKELEEKIMPPIDDEFAKKTGLAEDLSTLQTKLREELAKVFEDQNTQAKEKALFEALIEKNPFEVPEVMVDEEIRNLLFEMNALDRRAEKSYRIDVSPFRKPLQKQAEYRVKSLVIVDRIVEQDKIEPTDEEFEKWLDDLVTKSGFKSREELNKQFGLPQNAPRLRTILAREQATTRLLDKAKITEVPWKEKTETPE